LVTDSIIFNQMVKYRQKQEADQLNLVFMALADSTRRAILARLAEGDALVSELAEPFDISLPAVSKHLGILERARLIQREKDGRMRRCVLQPEELRGAAEWIAFYRQFWERNLDSLDSFLNNTKQDDGGSRS